MNVIGEFFRQHWIKLIVSFVIGLLLMVIYNSVRGTWNMFYTYVDGGFIAGAVLFLIGMLSLVNSFGAFDLSSFFFRRKRIDENRKEDYYEYVQRRSEERKGTRSGFLPYVFVGIMYILFSVIGYFAGGFA